MGPWVLRAHSMALSTSSRFVTMPGRDPVSFGKFHKIRRKHVHCGIALLEEEFLPLPNHAKEVVVHDGDLHIRTLLNGGCQFRSGHLESAIACDRPDFLILVRKPRADRGGQAKAHRSRAAEVIQRFGFSSA